MAIPRRYRNPPVVEALCEMFFVGSEWDDTLAGRFHERVREEFPRKRQQEIRVGEVTFAFTGETSARAGRLPPRIHFLTEEGDRVLQLGQDLLVVNQLRPYRAFHEWEETLRTALNHYCELANPRACGRLGIRYIDRVIIPGDRPRLEEYFTLYPRIPEEWSGTNGSFLVRVEMRCARPGHRLFVTFGSAPVEQPGTTAFLLDYYDQTESPEGVALGDVLEEVRAAHDHVVDAFEASITERLRALFEPEERS
jgi:uncharacterized protein (TIGR04255 family)